MRDTGSGLGCWQCECQDTAIGLFCTSAPWGFPNVTSFCPLLACQRPRPQVAVAARRPARAILCRLPLARAFREAPQNSMPRARLAATPQPAAVHPTLNRSCCGPAQHGLMKAPPRPAGPSGRPGVEPASAESGAVWIQGLQSGEQDEGELSPLGAAPTPPSQLPAIAQAVGCSRGQQAGCMGPLLPGAGGSRPCQRPPCFPALCWPSP